MSSTFLPIIGSGIVFLLYLALAAMLVRKYKSTGDAGFIWLGVAVVIWPLIAHMVNAGAIYLMPHVVRSHATTSKAFSPNGSSASDNFLITLNFVEQAVGVVLLMIAVAFLSRKESVTAASMVSTGVSSSAGTSVSGD